MQLTEHFSTEKLIHSDTAIRLGINNTPSSPEVLSNLNTTAEILEDIRGALSEKAGRETWMHVLSGYRCEALERFLCAKDFNRWCYKRNLIPSDVRSWMQYFITKSHPNGQGADFIAPRFGSPYSIVKEIALRPEIMAKVDQIIMEGSWVHVSWRHNPRGMVLTAKFNERGEPSYTEGLVT